MRTVLVLLPYALGSVRTHQAHVTSARLTWLLSALGTEKVPYPLWAQLSVRSPITLPFKAYTGVRVDTERKTRTSACQACCWHAERGLARGLQSCNFASSL